MRRLVTFLFSLILVLSLNVSIGWAASGSYSPGQPPDDPPSEPTVLSEDYLVPIDVTLKVTQEGYAIIYDDKDKPVRWVKIIVTPFADRSNTPYEDIEEMLDRAYKQILGVEKVTELTKQLQPYVKEDRKLGISDLFDVSVKGSDEPITVEYLAREGYTIRFKLRLPIEDGEFWLPLHNYEGYQWRIVQNRSAEGNIVTLRVDSLSPFAIVRESMGKPDEPEPATSTDTDEPDTPGGPDRPIGPVIPNPPGGDDEPGISTGTDEPGITTGTDRPTTGTDIHEGEHCMCKCTGLLPCCLCWIKGFIVGVILTAIICIIIICRLKRKARKEREERQELEEELEQELERKQELEKEPEPKLETEPEPKLETEPELDMEQQFKLNQDFTINQDFKIDQDIDK